jgi:hypothetical protein
MKRERVVEIFVNKTNNDLPLGVLELDYKNKILSSKILNQTNFFDKKILKMKKIPDGEEEAQYKKYRKELLDELNKIRIQLIGEGEIASYH